MSPKLATTTKKGQPPAKLPEPAERREAELTGRPEKKLLTAGHRHGLLLALLLLIAILTLLLVILQ